jgi:DNA/RNA-binding domain of Phe-tRNA-synthetase-like protein
MHFSHSAGVLAEYPELVAGVVRVDGIRPDADVSEAVERWCDAARQGLGPGGESELPAIKAWRRTFARMGLKPTQYRCAAESLLRRLRKEGDLPRLHPLVDLCNALSAAHATPIAVFDLARIDGDLTVRHAAGNERYLAFDGTIETPPPGEIVFADAAGQAHARRWCHRQSAASAVSATTDSVLIVAEAMHDEAQADVARLTAALRQALAAAGFAPRS